MLNLFTVICGLNDKVTKKQEKSTNEATRLISDIVLKYSYGATLTDCNGIYTHENGQTVFEKSIKIEVCGIKKIKAKKMAVEIKQAMNQESIYFSFKNKVMFL